MHKRFIVISYRLAFGLLALVAVTVQFVQGFDRQGYNPVNFFHFFTIESNIFAAGILLLAGFAALKSKPHSDRFARLRGAATVYMTVTGIVYVSLLSGLEASLQTPTPWINTVLHYVMPIVVLGDWLLMPPRRRIAFGRAAAWLVFPAAYGVYSLIRGHFVDWYPYPFLNPTEQGYAGVAMTGMVIAMAIVAIVWAVSQIPGWRSTRRR